MSVKYNEYVEQSHNATVGINHLELLQSV